MPQSKGRSGRAAALRRQGRRSPAIVCESVDAPSASILRDQHVLRLDAELRLASERLQATVEELETSKEELQSVNEELQSVNRELARQVERQRLLMSELQRRVRNILAVVRSITSRTLQASDDLEAFSSHFEGRLHALARAQGVLARSVGGAADVDEVVREELLSHTVGDGDQVEIDGPSVRLGQRAAETFSLAVHELATNALKYGALSRPSGRIAVSWRVMNTNAGPRLSFEWRERGVAVVDPKPSRKGFGRELIERGLPYDLPGSATALSFAPGGVQCRIEIPLNDYAAEPLEDHREEARSEATGPEVGAV